MNIGQRMSIGVFNPIKATVIKHNGRLVLVELDNKERHWLPFWTLKTL